MDISMAEALFAAIVCNQFEICANIDDGVSRLN